jgi:hypothetical protein
METVRLNFEHDFLLQRTKLASDALDKDVERPVNHIHFVICNSCYWCASYFSIDNMETSSQVLRCLLCNSHDTELIPVSSNESFRIEYNVTKGMETEFYKSNIIVDKHQSATEQHQVPIYF